MVKLIWPVNLLPGLLLCNASSLFVPRRATTRTPLLTLQGHTQPVSTVVWPTGDEVLSAGMDHCIRIWDIVSGVNKSTLVTSTK